MEGIEIKVALDDGAEAILRIVAVEDWDKTIPSEIFPARIRRLPTAEEVRRIWGKTITD